jgi:hypothetical protein
MKLVVRVKLLPTPEQASALDATLRADLTAGNLGKPGSTTAVFPGGSTRELCPSGLSVDG